MKALSLAILLPWGLLLQAAGAAEEPPFADVFRYFAENVYTFSPDGTVCRLHDAPRSRKDAALPPLTLAITGDGCYRVTDAAGHAIQGQPGEILFPAGAFSGKYYLISEKDFACKTLVRWLPESGKCFPVGRLHAADACNVMQNRNVIVGVQYADRQWEYFDPRFTVLHQRITARHPGGYPVWRECSPVQEDLWLAELFFADRPSLWLLADLSKESFQSVSAALPPLPQSGTKSEITYDSYDGTPISAVLTMPAPRCGTTDLPLVIFPHGGPGALEQPFYDHRVAVLNHYGFAVLQPNYRGSAGFGKEFRFSGWKSGGIAAALDDLSAGAERLIRQGVADRKRIMIFGGSWGGFCAAASLARDPQRYCCGAAFFGAFDLPAMLRTFPPDSGGNRALDRLQYGDVDDAAEMAALAAIDPCRNAAAIAVPLLLLHHRQDKVIDFAQSAAFCARLQQSGKKVIFLNGPGEHGFQSPEKEAEAYRQLIAFFQSVPAR